MSHYLSAKLLIGVIGGGVAGFLWYRFVGCKSGTCPLSSNPYVSVIYGMVMGALIADEAASMSRIRFELKAAEIFR